MAVKPIPDGYHAVTPYLVVPDAAGLMEFLKRVFGAAELFPPMAAPGGKIGHAELRVGDSPLMVADASAEYPALTGMFHVYVPDVDAAYRRALDAGATPVREPADQFYGDRVGVARHSGIVWSIATHVEDVPPEELERRAAAQHQ